MYSILYNAEQPETKEVPQGATIDSSRLALAERRFYEKSEAYINNLLTQQAVPTQDPERPVFTDVGLAIEKTTARWLDAPTRFFSDYEQELEPKEPNKVPSAMTKTIFGLDFFPGGLYRPQALVMSKDISIKFSEVLKSKNIDDLGFFGHHVRLNGFLSMSVETAVRIVRYSLQMLASLQFFDGVRYDIENKSISQTAVQAIAISYSESLCELLSAYTFHMVQTKYRKLDEQNYAKSRGRVGDDDRLDYHFLPTIMDCIPVFADFVKRYSELTPREAAPYKKQLVVVMLCLKAIEEFCHPTNKCFWPFLPVTDASDVRENAFLAMVLRWFYDHNVYHHIQLVSNKHPNWREVLPGIPTRTMHHKFNFPAELCKEILRNEREHGDVPAGALFLAQTLLAEWVFEDFPPLILYDTNTRHRRSWTTVTGRHLNGTRPPYQKFPPLVKFCTRREAQWAMENDTEATLDIEALTSVYEQELLEPKPERTIFEMIREEEDIQLTNLAIEGNEQGPPGLSLDEELLNDNYPTYSQVLRRGH